VTQWFHQASGLGAARKFTLAHGDALTEVEIYAGDPNYQVTAETFAAPPAAPVDAKRP